MTRRRVALIIAGAGLASAALVAQDVLRPAGDGPAAPLAISGSASSAEYCVSGYAARIHSLGWIDAGTTYRVTFDSGISLVAAVARMNLSDRRVTSGYGTPDLNFTASSSGIMALLVSSNGRDGCYRYKAQITSPAASVAVARPDSPVRPDPALALPKSPIETMAIAGEASSARHCIAGTWTAKVHDLGWVGEGARVTIDFDSNFDAIAGLTITDVAGQSTVSYVDDNAGGNLDPRFNLTTTRAGTAVLYVGGVNGSAGCYAYKAAITAPAVTLSQFNGSWSGTFTGSSSGTVAFSVSNGTVTVTQPDAGSGTVTQRNALGLGIVPLADCIDGRDCGFHGQFFTRAATGTCTWSGPFLPGGARQSSATGLWSCTDGRSGEWNSRRGTPPAPVPTPTPTPTPAPTPTPTPGGPRWPVSRGRQRPVVLVCRRRVHRTVQLAVPVRGLRSAGLHVQRHRRRRPRCVPVPERRDDWCRRPLHRLLWRFRLEPHACRRYLQYVIPDYGYRYVQKQHVSRDDSGYQDAVSRRPQGNE